MPFLSFLPAGLSLLGGLMGSEEKTVGKVEATAPKTSTTNSSHGSSSLTQQKIDPRMEAAIYGAGGIVPTATDWYNNNRSGLNEKMITGMNNQWNQLGASKQGFDQMQNLGMGLMGGGTAGNPFTGGGGIAPQQLTYKPAEFGANSSVNSPFVMPVSTPIAAAMPASSGGGGGGGGGGGDGNYGSPIGDALQAAMNAGVGNGAPAPEPIYDVEGMLTGYRSGSGYRPQDWSNPSGYSFNNGYTAYGADGSSAANPSGGGY